VAPVQTRPSKVEIHHVATVSRVALLTLVTLAAGVVAQQDLVAWADMFYGFADFLDDTGSCSAYQSSLILDLVASSTNLHDQTR
jgi:hypothetical protein